MSILSLLAQAGDTYSTYDSVSDPYYTTGGSTTTTVDPAVFVSLMIGYLVFLVVLYVINSWLLSRIFKKAGQEPWKAWIPIYNLWVFMEMGDQKGFWAVLMLVPFINVIALVFSVIAAYNIGLKLQKSGAFVLLYLFLPIVWIIWLAFDKSTWQGSTAGTVQLTQSGGPAVPQPPVPPAQPPQPPVPPATPPTA